MILHPHSYLKLGQIIVWVSDSLLFELPRLLFLSRMICFVYHSVKLSYFWDSYKDYSK